MGSYKKLYEESRESGSVKVVTPEYFRWTKDGQQVIGAFIAKAAVRSRLGGDPYNQYLFDTDEGPVKFALGKSADNELGEVFARGVVYVITFKGKEKISGGRSVNRFVVEELGVEVDITGDEGGE